ncbi:MAG: pectate lyase family protein [Fibrobacterota bacterium]
MRNCRFIRNNGLSIVFTLVAAFCTLSDIQAQGVCESFGWANYDGQTEKGAVTGGATATAIQVTTFAALKTAVESSDAKVIHVMNDVGSGYKGTSGDVLNFKSNKTIIGAKAGITVKCSFQISSDSNIIVKNLIIRGPGNSNSEQNWDAVNIQGSKRIWFDHCTIMEGEDGNFDVVKGSDNVTVSWCKFTYVTGGEHNLSNLIGSSDDESVSHGKLNVTYAYCWWENVNSRCPRTRYGKIHVLNSYYNKVGDGAFAGKMSNVRVEGCYFESNVSNPTGLISTGGQSGVFTIGCNKEGTKMDGYTSAFVPPYQYKKYNNSEVKSMVTTNAGPTLTSPSDCGGSVSVNKHPATLQNCTLNPLITAGKISVALDVKLGDKISMTVVDLTGRKVGDWLCVCDYTGRTTKLMDLRGIKSGAYVFKLNLNGREIAQQVFKK